MSAIHFEFPSKFFRSALKQKGMKIASANFSFCALVFFSMTFLTANENWKLTHVYQTKKVKGISLSFSHSLGCKKTAKMQGEVTRKNSKCQITEKTFARAQKLK
jgi:hypothetical protein